MKDFENVDFNRLLGKSKKINCSTIKIIDLKFKTNSQILNKEHVKELFNNYIFISTSKNFKRDIYQMQNEGPAYRIRKIILHNLLYSIEKLKNYYHISIWNQLKFLVDSETFNVVDFIDDKDYGELMIDIFMNNIIEIIQFLTDSYNDIWLACIISYIFQELFNFSKKKVLRIQMEAFENLRRYKLYNISAKLMKFAIYEELKNNKKNNLFLMSCKKCGCVYDATDLGSCNNCKTKIRCQIW